MKKLVFKGQDEWGPVQVYDSKFLRELHFGNSIVQSSMYLRDPFALEMMYNRIMMLPLLFMPDPKKVLFLGLGGAAKPKFLWKYFPDCQCVIVERSKLIVDVAERFFNAPEDARFDSQVADAYAFLERSPEKQYDLLFIDLYVADKLADTLSQPRFFKLCRSCLKQEGILIWNLWESTPHDVKEYTFKHLVEAFGDRILILPNEESPNYCVTVFPDPLPPMTRELLTTRAQQLKERTGTDFPELLASVKEFKGFGKIYQDFR